MEEGRERGMPWLCGEEDEATIGFWSLWARNRRDPKTRG